MTPSLKVLHDALMIIQRDKTSIEASLQLASSDIQDSDTNFTRRVQSLQEQSDGLKAQIDKLVQARANVEKEILRMREVRSAGPSYIHSRRTKLKQLEIQERTVQLAILQQELVNAT